MKSLFSSIINYLLPPESYNGNKITNHPWFQKGTAFAPFIIIGTVFLILVWGIFASNPLNFFIKPHYFAVLSITFWLGLIAFAVHHTRKHKRDPSIFQLFASFIALSDLFSLLFFSLASHYISEQKNTLELKKQQISQVVQAKLQDHKNIWDEHSKTLHQRRTDTQDKIDHAFSALDNRMGSSLERIKEANKKDFDVFWKGVK